MYIFALEDQVMICKTEKGLYSISQITLSWFRLWT